MAMARRKDQDARRQQLRGAAQRAIVTRGADAVRVKDIAQEAGLSSQSVLYYYPDIDDLIEEAIRHAIERFAERRAALADSISDPREQLVATIRSGFPTGPEDDDLRVLYESSAYFGKNPAMGALIRALTASQVELYRRILEVGHAVGTFELADESQAIARNLVALEDAYGLYIIGGAPIQEEAIDLVLRYASLATRRELTGSDRT
jgi:DNA-binding transcriptional regulator YbjK